MEPSKKKRLTKRSGNDYKSTIRCLAHRSPLQAAIHRGKRYIVFDRGYTSWGEGETDWHAIGVAGHEIGHHLASHVFTSELSNHAEELVADQFAGFAMGFLGARTDQALTLFPGNRPASASHPADADRRIAVKAGWERGA